MIENGFNREAHELVFRLDTTSELDVLKASKSFANYVLSRIRTTNHNSPASPLMLDLPWYGSKWYHSVVRQVSGCVSYVRHDKICGHWDIALCSRNPEKAEFI